MRRKLIWLLFLVITLVTLVGCSHKHKYTEEVVAPTCTEKGYTKYTCECGESYTGSEVDAKGHNYGEWTVTKEATETEEGSKQRSCSECSEVETESIPKVKHEHKYAEAVTKPTCTEKGYTTYTCQCGDTYKDKYTDALGHKEEVIPGVAATCTKAGLTDGKKCSVCGEILVEQKEAPALGHKEEVLAAVAPTCTKTGLTEGKKCSVCGEILVAQQEVAALGHKEEVIPGYAATCTEKGLTEGKKCSVCGEILVAQQEVAALGHKEEVLAAVAPTCTTTGLTEGKKCSVCGETTLAQEVIPALGHSEKVIEAVAPTCTTTGSTEGKECSVCGEILSVVEEIAALGHTYSEVYSYNDSNHWFAYTCEHVNEKKDFAEHEFEAVVTEPTCDTDGYTTYTCECGYSYISDYTDQKGHEVETWNVSSSTLYDKTLCKYSVVYKGACINCSQEQTRTAYEEKHSLYWEVKEVAYCSQDGLEVQLCTEEECKYHNIETPKDSRVYTDIENHKWDSGEISGSTTIYSCENCSATKKVVSATGSSAEVDDFDEVDEVEISGITIEFDKAVKENLGTSNVKVGADTLKDDKKQDAIDDFNLDQEQIDLIGDKPIYDFKLETDELISDLGGTATIRIPYTLAPGENPSSIIVWYISEDGIEPITDVKYSNGFVEFTTEHFSYYTAAGLSPKQYCKYYGHPKNQIKDVPATCLEQGYEVCLRCGEILSQSKATGHKWQTDEKKAPTCEKQGSIKYKCILCSTSYKTPTPALGHYYTVVSSVDSTCSKAGSVLYKCAHCQDSYSVTTAQLPHNYTTIVVNSTCTSEGYKEKVCKDCGDTVVLSKEKLLPHTYSTEWSKSEKGHYHVCTVCGEAGKVEKHIPGPEATEENAQVCLVCEYVIVPQLAHVHTLTKVEEVAATCTTNGNIAYYVCRCGKWFFDEKAENLIADHSAVVVSAKGHQLVNVEAVAPTCTEVGYTAGIYCSACKQYLRGHNEIQALGHVYAPPGVVICIRKLFENAGTSSAVQLMLNRWR